MSSGGYLMQSFRDWFAKRSWWTVAAIMAILWAAGMYGIQAAIRPDRAGWGWLAGSLASGVLYGIFMALVFRNLQKKYGGGDTAGAIEKAIKKGRLPQGVQPEVWLPLLERKRRSDRFLTWAGPIEFGLFAALELYLGITEPGVWFWWLAAVAFVCFGIWTPVWAVRRRPRIDALIAGLKAQ